MSRKERPVYYVSTRPEAYEYWAEIGPEEARALGALIAERAARHFPGIEFRADDAWHAHPPGTEAVAAYIDSHWQGWAAAAARRGARTH